MTEDIRQLTYTETLCFKMLLHGFKDIQMDKVELKEKLEPFFPITMIDGIIQDITGDKEFIFDDRLPME